MRPRGGGVGPNRPNRVQRPAVRPVYEDFRPVSERHQEEQAEKLLIFLPGGCIYFYSKTKFIVFIF